MCPSFLEGGIVMKTINNDLSISESILEKACRDLEYANSNNFFDLEKIDLVNLDIEYLGKVYWLELAKRIGASKVFFIDDFPVALFFDYQQFDGNLEEKLYGLHLQMWNMSKAPLFFVALPDEFRVYSSYRKPCTSLSEWAKEKRHLIGLKEIINLAEVFAGYSRQELESEKLFKKENIIESSYRADSCLLKNLKLLRLQLESMGLKREYSHALIGRSIFIRYLEDRKVLVEEYFSEISNGNALNYLSVLSNKKFTYNLFRELKKDFNGDMFPMSDEEESSVGETHINVLRNFLEGKSLDKQQELFFWAYQFNIIPIELISNIYEEFYHKKTDDKRGTHYTPAVLAEFVLSECLTVQRLAKDPRVLDPACGSGIFLVEAFRRLVFYKRKKSGRMPNPSQLIAIIKNQIFGIDVNSEALRVAAFSLYLALLDFMKPADIRVNRLPKLVYNSKTPSIGGNNLFLSDSFCFTEKERIVITNRVKENRQYKGKIGDERLIKRKLLPIGDEGFDIIVGNPPWGQALGEDGEYALPWCTAFGYSVGDKELSQCFIWRTQHLLKADGEIGLLVSTGVFFKHSDNSQNFRSSWMEKSAIRAVFNFAHVRHTFFGSNSKEAVSPFAAVFFKPANKEDALNNKVFYASVKQNSLTDKLQAVVIDKSDCRKISQRRLRSDGNLWKIYLWGKDLDVELLTELDIYPKLGDICLERKWLIGQGYTPGHIKDSAPIKEYPELNISAFKRYQDIQVNPLECFPKLVHRYGIPELYSGNRIIIKRGITERENPKGQIIARMITNPMCFRNSVHCIRLDGAHQWEIKILLGILWSSLTRYYHFLTASTWGFWHHEIHLSEHLKLPICFPKEDSLRERIVSLVDQLSLADEIPQVVLRQIYDPQEKRRLERQLDEAIFDLYDLSDEQKDLVWDFCEKTIEFFYNGIDSDALKPPNKEELKEYICAFQEVWDERLCSRKAKLVSKVYAPDHCGLFGIFFDLVNRDSDEGNVFFDESSQSRQLFKKLEAFLPLEKSKDIFISRVFRLINQSNIFVVKRAEKILWTKSQARHDAYEFLAEVFKREQILDGRNDINDI